MRRPILILFLGLAGLLCGCTHRAHQLGLDDGYLLGTSDGIKRAYWLKQREERRFNQEGTRHYYSWEAPEETRDGRRLVPHPVVVPIVE